MYHEWEFVQEAMEQWHDMENKPCRDRARLARLRLLVDIAMCYIDFGKGYNGDEPTTKRAVRIARGWLERDVSGCRSWVDGG